jgi:hypothetical protein
MTTTVADTGGDTKKKSKAKVTRSTTMAVSSSLLSVMEHIINTCGFPDDSTMVEVFRQEGWTGIADITMITMAEADGLFVANSDGSYKAKPMMFHIRQFKAFLMYYNRKCCDLSTALNDEDVLNITKTELFDYMGSPGYRDDIEEGLSKSTKPTTSAAYNNEFMASDFCKGIKRDKTHYMELKDDKYFHTCNRGFVSTAYTTNHTQLVLDENYVPRTHADKELFQEMQFFMYAVFELKLKSDKGKSLFNDYESTRDAQKIFAALKRHAMQLTAAHISGDALLKYITSARFPGNWRVTSYAFVLHWKEQVSQNERLELKDIPPKQKLRMLKNTVADITELQSVKKIEDYCVARGETPLGWEEYLELLLSACSQYGKAHSTTRQTQERNVHATNLAVDEDYYSHPDHTLYGIDRDLTKIYANATQTAVPGTSSGTSQFLPRDQWLKLTQEQRDEILAERRKSMGRCVELTLILWRIT